MQNNNFILQGSIKKNIANLFTKGKKHKGAHVTLFVIKDNKTILFAKFLFTCSKQIKHKVKRNTIKRRMREIIRSIYPSIKPHYIIALIGINAQATYAELYNDIFNLFTTIQIIN